MPPSRLPTPSWEWGFWLYHWQQIAASPFEHGPVMLGNDKFLSGFDAQGEFPVLSCFASIVF
jgi:hypothetical protein